MEVTKKIIPTLVSACSVRDFVQVLTEAKMFKELHSIAAMLLPAAFLQMSSVSYVLYFLLLQVYSSVITVDKVK